MQAEKTIEEIKELTVEAWSKLPERPTLEIDCRFGKVFFACDKPEHDALITEGNICFSPMELNELTVARLKGAVGDEMMDGIILAKREFAGAKLTHVLRDGHLVVERKVEKESEVRFPEKPKKKVVKPEPKKQEQVGLI